MIDSSGMWGFVLFGRVATDTSKYHRAVSSGSSTPSRPLNPADEDCDSSKEREPLAK